MTESSGIRVSSIGEWMTCEAMALESPKREGTINAATYVGMLAHARLTGMYVEEPNRVTWDTSTPSGFHANVQADAIFIAADKSMRADGWDWQDYPTEFKVTREHDVGHLDMIATQVRDGVRAIIDLKTGRIGAGWLQVGGYLYLADDPSIQYGGILHVPRVPIGRDPVATLELRPAPALIAAWQVARQRVTDIQLGAPATRSPGVHCRRCLARCPVRENSEE